MKNVLIIVLLFLCGGCLEYLHAPDEISFGANMSETNFGRQGKAPTTGASVRVTFYRKGKE